MNKTLINDNYLIIPNFILSETAIEIGKRFEEFCNNVQAEGDSQAPHSKSVYSYFPLVELQCLQTVNLSRIVGNTLLPTYNYARVYGQGDELKPHKDRESCEVSITLCLDENGPAWPIFMTKPDGNVSSISLFPGDAIVYLGCRSTHWRGPLHLPKYKQAFLHYVKADGPFAGYAFEFITKGINQPSAGECCNGL